MTSPAMEIALGLLQSGISKTAIGKEIGYSHPTMSQYFSGKYGGGVDAIEAAILKRYEKRLCPHDGEEKPPAHCGRIANRPRPQGFPDAETQWIACQTCQHKPHQGESK